MVGILKRTSYRFEYFAVVECLHESWLVILRSRSSGSLCVNSRQGQLHRSRTPPHHHQMHLHLKNLLGNHRKRSAKTLPGLAAQSVESSVRTECPRTSDDRLTDRFMCRVTLTDLKPSLQDLKFPLQLLTPCLRRCGFPGDFRDCFRGHLSHVCW